MNSKCIICKKRKGKRFCPAQGAVICPPCCGNRIYTRKDCPESCIYWKSSQSFKKEKQADLATGIDEAKKAEYDLIVLMEMAIYDVLKKDDYYEDKHIVQGIERKIDALRHPEKALEILLNRIGLVESELDEVIKRVQYEDNVRFSSERILNSLKIYGRFIKEIEKNEKGTNSYIANVKERMKKYEEGLKHKKLEGEDISDYPLIFLP